MPHAQQQVLEAVQAALVAGPTAAGPRVYLDRVDRLPPGDLPAVLVDESPDGETTEPGTIHGVDQRQLGVVVRGLVSHGTTAAADARALGLQIERALTASTVLQALCRGGFRMEASRHVNEGDGDRLMAEREQLWRFVYWVDPATPDILF
jgi:hypothetical protein